MAILYGTTSDGTTLPVQVNALGQLVAQGMDGVQGPQGPEGKPGPPGPPGADGAPGDSGLEAEQGQWTPYFGNTEGGEAIIDYSVQQGYWYKVGGMLTVWWLIMTREVIITNPRGTLDVMGLPESFVLDGSSALRQGHYTVGEWGGLKPQDEAVPFIRLAGPGDQIRLFKRTIPNETVYKFTDLDEQNPEYNNIGGAWTGLCASNYYVENGVLMPKSPAERPGLTA